MQKKAIIYILKIDNIKSTKYFIEIISLSKLKLGLSYVKYVVIFIFIYYKYPSF